MLFLKKCVNNHTQGCSKSLSIVTKQILTQSIFNEYLDSLYIEDYGRGCIAQTSQVCIANVNFIKLSSRQFIIPCNIFIKMLKYNNVPLEELLKNQLALNSNYVNMLCEIRIEMQYNLGYFMRSQYDLLNKNTFNLLLNNMSIEHFIRLLANVNPKNNCEILLDVIKKYKNALIHNESLIKALIEKIYTVPSLVGYIYEIISTSNVSYKNSIIKYILHKAIENLNIDTILLIFDNNDFSANETMLELILKKPQTNNDYTKKLIAEIIDIFIKYGLPVNRDLVIKLLNNKLYINKITKYDIVLDNNIQLILMSGYFCLTSATTEARAETIIQKVIWLVLTSINLIQ